MNNPTASTYALLFVVGQHPGLTIPALSQLCGRLVDAVRNDLYIANRQYTTRVYTGQTLWFLTERGREYVRSRGGQLRNDDALVPAYYSN